MEAKGAQSVIVDLDVGGTLFRTTRQTLMSDPDSMLAKMFDPNASPVSVLRTDGAYFINRDPVYFRVVLNFLRTGYLDKIDDCVTYLHFSEKQVSLEFDNLSLPFRGKKKQGASFS